MGAYLSANLNANTGLEIGADGVEVNVFGLGVTVGIGGKWTTLQHALRLDWRSLNEPPTYQQQQSFK